MFDGRYCLSLRAYIYTASKYRCLESVCVFISHLILTHRGNPVLCNTKTEKNLLVCLQPSFLGFDAALGQKSLEGDLPDICGQTHHQAYSRPCAHTRR